MLTAYRDAIQYIHDQTVRGINKGLTPDQLVDFVSLPEHLAQHPWLAEHYGTVAWSVRAVFDGYIGWFSGDGVDLEPLGPVDRSKRLAAAFKSGKTLPDQARAAQKAGDHQWAAELARHWLNTDPASEAARGILANALSAKAQHHINSNARHWYLTEARELRGELEIGKPVPSDLPDDMLDGLPIDTFMAGMATRLKAEEALATDSVVSFTFEDIKRSITAHVRRGVAAIEEGANRDADIQIKTTAAVWKRLATKKRNPALAFASGDIEVDGGIIDVVRFLALFER